MPLDTGALAEGTFANHDVLAKRPRLTLDPAGDVGAALKAARESLGLSLDDIAETTRVRARHLGAIEAGAVDQLPSRPFTIGYVRAYAQALGADADSTAARYRQEHPSPDDDLHGPVGVRHNRPKRSPWLIGIAAVGLIAIVGWNVTQHVAARPQARQAVAAPRLVGPPPTNAANGPYPVGAPLPPPAEATAPAAYHTPVVGPDAPANAINGPQTPAVASASTPFVAQGTIYGAKAGASNLIIQAQKSISLEIRGPGGAIYFAGQLAAGEAYRVPALPGLVAEVSNPASAELYEGGMSKGVFTAPQMPLKTAG